MSKIYSVHKQVYIAPDITVDEGILPLVSALREFEDIQTLASCEGDIDQDGYVFFKHNRGASFLLHFVNDLADKLRACLTACCEYKIRVEWLAGSESPVAELVVSPGYITNLTDGLKRITQSPAANRNAKKNPYARTYHKGDKINQHGGVSALCFKRPRSISHNVRWTTDDRAVTCKKCLAIMSKEPGNNTA